MISKKQSKFIKSLKIKKYRQHEKCFIVEGRKNVMELIHSHYQIRYLLATPQFLNENHLPQSILSKGLLEVSPQQLQDLGTFKTNNDCMAIAEMITYERGSFDTKKHIVALDGVGDPGNLGTIIRTMDWFGFDQLVCSPSTAEIYNPKVINSTMGSFIRVKFIYEDLAAFIDDMGVAAYGADLSGVSLSKWKPSAPCMVVMGSESHGLSEEVKKRLISAISIPKVGGAESLNVAIATGIICHHLRS